MKFSGAGSSGVGANIVSKVGTSFRSSWEENRNPTWCSQLFQLAKITSFLPPLSTFPPASQMHVSLAFSLSFVLICLAWPPPLYLFEWVIDFCCCASLGPKQAPSSTNMPTKNSLNCFSLLRWARRLMCFPNYLCMSLASMQAVTVLIVRWKCLTLLNPGTHVFFICQNSKGQNFQHLNRRYMFEHT